MTAVDSVQVQRVIMTFISLHYKENYIEQMFIKVISVRGPTNEVGSLEEEKVI